MADKKELSPDEKVRQMKEKNHAQRQAMRNRIKYLAERDENYVVKVINGNYELISELFKRQSFKKGIYTPKELQFIQKVKKHIVQNEVYMRPEFEEQFFASDVHYMKAMKVGVGRKFTNVVEIDLDEAYWKTAHIFGIIDDETYSLGKKGTISKQARLTALGSLAKRVYYYQFKGKEVIERREETNELLENLWFTICKRVSDVMHEAIEALGDDFIFYWVDGIYLVNTPENIAKVMHIFTQYGYNTKIRNINQIYFHAKGFAVNDFGTSIREFNYPNYHTHRRLDYFESVELSDFANKMVDKDFDIVNEIEKKYYGDKNDSKE